MIPAYLSSLFYLQYQKSNLEDLRRSKNLFKLFYAEIRKKNGDNLKRRNNNDNNNALVLY